MGRAEYVAALSAMAFGLFVFGSVWQPTAAGAQTRDDRCRSYVNGRLIWRQCCYRCVAWDRGAPGTFVGPCRRWRIANYGRCAPYDGRL